MSYEYLALSSEIAELESILASIPEEEIISRLSFESRLISAKEGLAKLVDLPVLKKAKLTFRGRPVVGTHGIAADFGSKATGAFADAFAAVVAGLNESLGGGRGPIPDKAKNQLLITGTAIGSFGFEFELPTQKIDIFPDAGKTEEAFQKLQELLKVSAEGTDDQMTEIVEEIHPRAVKKISDFLGYLVQQQAWCGLEFGDRFFRYQDIDQLRTSAERLKEENIHQRDVQYIGEFVGVLPNSRTFEFKATQNNELIKGKVDIGIDDPDCLNRDWLHKPITLKLTVIQVGQGRPRFTLPDLASIESI